MSKHILRRSGIPAGSRLPGRAPVGLALAAVLLATGCNYSFRAGAGFPEYIETVAILPFENQTNRFELTDDLHQQLLQELPRALGVTPAGESVADAVVRGVITRYDLSAPNYRPSEGGNRAEVLQREIRIGVQVQIVDLQQNLILWEDRGLSANAQYPEASGTEEEGRREAIDLLVQEIVDGAQSNW